MNALVGREAKANLASLRCSGFTVTAHNGGGQDRRDLGRTGGRRHLGRWLKFEALHDSSGELKLPPMVRPDVRTGWQRRAMATVLVGAIFLRLSIRKFKMPP